MVSVPSGWLVGFDAGEFGGGLWWFSRDGREVAALFPLHHRQQVRLTSTMPRTFVACQKSQDSGLR